MHYRSRVPTVLNDQPEGGGGGVGSRSTTKNHSHETLINYLIAPRRKRKPDDFTVEINHYLRQGNFVKVFLNETGLYCFYFIIILR